MTQEDKQLLLADLCARLPYGVKIHRVLYGAITLNERMIESFRRGLDDILIPYLRPMSSMTDKEREEYHSLCFDDELEVFECGEWIIKDYYHDTIYSIDWLNAHHFDYRELIPKGLAIEVTKENNPYYAIKL